MATSATAGIAPAIQTSQAAARILTADSLDAICRDRPFALRKALGLVARLERGRLAIDLPDGERILASGQQPGPTAHLAIRDLAFLSRLFGDGDIGVGESYILGEWESEDVTSFIELFCANRPLIARMLDERPLVRWMQRLRHFLNRNTRRGARRNIHAHYDLGNAFYASWLDPTFTYSSAMFAPGDTDLARGQLRKYRAIAAALDLQAGHHLLEVGCGWGGFAEFAARTYGCRVTGITISREQAAFTQARIAEAGLADRVTIELCDYRDVTGTFDRIVSIEMLEAVGEAYWQVYFRSLRDRLAPQGRAGLQVITINEQDFGTYRAEIDFIRRYIFPGGMLPTPTILRGLADETGFALAGEVAFGRDYASTLALWRERFLKAWPRLTTMGFDERFRRLWTYYLSYCEGGFRNGSIDVRQFILQRN